MALLPHFCMESCPQLIIPQGKNQKVCFFADED